MSFVFLVCFVVCFFFFLKVNNYISFANIDEVNKVKIIWWSALQVMSPQSLLRDSSRLKYFCFEHVSQCWPRGAAVLGPPSCGSWGPKLALALPLASALRA